MPVKDSYKYGIASTAAGQLGVVLLFSIGAVPKQAMMPPPVNLCSAYSDLCGTALNYYQCPANMKTIAACSNINDPSTYIGICTCGSFDMRFVYAAYSVFV